MLCNSFSCLVSSCTVFPRFLCSKRNNCNCPHQQSAQLQAPSLKICQRDLSLKCISLQKTRDATAIAAWQSLPQSTVMSTKDTNHLASVPRLRDSVILLILPCIFSQHFRVNIYSTCPHRITSNLCILPNIKSKLCTNSKVLGDANGFAIFTHSTQGNCDSFLLGMATERLFLCFICIMTCRCRGKVWPDRKHSKHLVQRSHGQQHQHLILQTAKQQGKLEQNSHYS